MAQEPASPSKPRLPTISTMFLNLLGCTAGHISPVEEMSYTTTSKRLTLTSPAPLDLSEEPRLSRNDSMASKASGKKGFRKKQSIIIGTPSGFQHEFHVTSQTELEELETLRTEVERRVQEAAARHAEMNAFAHRKESGLEDGYSSGYNSRRTSKGLSTGVKRKPVPSMYPYSPTPPSWSTATLSNMPIPARSPNFAYSEPGSSALDSTFESSISSSGPSTMASSVEELSLSCDEAESSSSSSSQPPSTPPTSSPQMSTVPELAASETGSISLHLSSKEDEQEGGEREERLKLSPQPSIFGIDPQFFVFDIFAAEESMTIGAGQAAKDARSDLSRVAAIAETLETTPLVTV